MIGFGRVATGMAAAVLVMVAACGGGEGGDGASSSSPPSAVAIPTIAQLQAALITPADVDRDLTIQSEDPAVGVIEFCSAASQASKDAAAALAFQAGTHLETETESGAVHVTEFLLAEGPDTVAATFDALRAGAEACYGQPFVPGGEGFTSDPYELPALGDQRVGEYHVMPGAYLHMAVVRDGPILMLLDVFEFTGDVAQDPAVTADEVTNIVTTAVGTLP